MIFLANESWFFSAVFGEILKTMLLIDSFLYDIIAVCFSYIVEVSSINFGLSDIIGALINRVYIIFGVFALFIVTYSLILALFEPNNMMKGKINAGTVIKNMVIAIALVAFMPTIFNYMYRFQDVVLDNNVIGAIVLGDNGSEIELTTHTGSKVVIKEEEVGYKNYVKIVGNQMSFTMLNSFLYSDTPDEKLISDDTTNFGGVFGSIISPFISINPEAGLWKMVGNLSKLAVVDEYDMTFNDIKNLCIVTGSFSSINLLPYVMMNADSNVHYVFFFSTICGIVTLYLLISFMLDVLVRVFKLFLLQIISPLPIFSMVIPNSKIFQNWMKETLSTFLSIFLRLFLLNFVVLVFASITPVIQTLLVTYSENYGSVRFNLCNALIPLALVLFLRQAPKLIRDMFGIKKSDGLLKKLVDSGGIGLAIGALSAGIGLFRGLNDPANSSTSQKLLGGLSGGFNGMTQGFKNGNSVKKPSDLIGAVKNTKDTVDKKRQTGIDYRNRKGIRNAGDYLKSKGQDAVEFFTGIGPGNKLVGYNAREQALNAVAGNYDNLENLINGKNDNSNRAKTSWENAKTRRDSVTDGQIIKDRREKLSQDLINYQNDNSPEGVARIKRIKEELLDLDNNKSNSEYWKLAVSNRRKELENDVQKTKALYDGELKEAFKSLWSTKDADLSLLLENANKNTKNVMACYYTDQNGKQQKYKWTEKLDLSKLEIGKGNSDDTFQMLKDVKTAIKPQKQSNSSEAMGSVIDIPDQEIRDRIKDVKDELEFVLARKFEYDASAQGKVKDVTFEEISKQLNKFYFPTDPQNNPCSDPLKTQVKIDEAMIQDAINHLETGATWTSEPTNAADAKNIIDRIKAFGSSKANAGAAGDIGRMHQERGYVEALRQAQEENKK